MLKAACGGIGTDEAVVYTILGGRSNREMDLLRKKFFDIYGEDLTQLIASELGGHLETLAVTLLQAGEKEFDEEFHTEDKVAEDVAILHEMGLESWGTDEAGLFKILSESPPEHLEKVNLAYAEDHGYTLSKVLDKELGGKLHDAAQFVLGMKLKPMETLAGIIKDSCAGFGTHELLLTCCLIRYQSLMAAINEKHVELYEKSVSDRVEEETGGDYKKLLLVVVSTGLSL